MATQVIGPAAIQYLSGDLPEEQLPQLPKRRLNPLANPDGTPNILGTPEIISREQMAQQEPPTSKTTTISIPSFLEQVGRRQYEAQSFEQEAASKGLVGLGEVGANVVTGMLGYGSGFATAIAHMYSDASRRNEPDYWKRLYNMIGENAASLTYQPRTEMGKTGAEVVGALMQPLQEFSRMASEAPLVRMALTEDQRYAVRAAHEVLTLSAVDPVLRGALGAVRGRVAKFRSEFGKIADTTPSEAPEMVKAAQGLSDAVQTNPEVNDALQAARKAGQEPVQAPTPIQPTGAAVGEQLTQARTLVDDLTDAAANLPEGTSPRVRDQVQADLARAREQLRTLEEAPQAPTSEPITVTETGSTDPVALATERVVRATEAVQTAKPGRDMEAAKQTLLVAQEELLALQKPTTIEPAMPTNSIELADLKARAREGLKSNEATKVGLERLGYTPEQIVELDPRLKRIRAKRSEEVTPPVEPALHGKKIMVEEPTATPVLPAAAETPSTVAPTGEVRYRPIVTLSDLHNSVLRVGTEGELSPDRSPIQVRTQNGWPVAVLFDDSGVNIVSSINEIRKQEARGQISPEIARVMEQKLQRQAEIAGVPIEQAHNFAAERLLSEITKLVQDQGLELYRAKRIEGGIEYEQVPTKVISAINKLAESSLVKPSALKKDEASAYVAEKTRDLGPATIEDIYRSLESGEDIKSRLPESTHESYDQLREIYRQGLDDSNTRTAADILLDLFDVIAPPDMPPTQLGMLSLYGITPARRAAMYRLYGDAQKVGRKFLDVLENAGVGITERILMNRHMQQLARPPIPPAPVDSRYAAIDPRAAAAGDPIIAQRKFRDGRTGPPLYRSEAELLQNATVLHDPAARQVYTKALTNPYYWMRRAGVERIIETYHAAQNAADLMKNELQKDLKQLAKPLNISAREKIGDYAIGQQPKGRQLVEKAGRTVPEALTPDELNFYQSSRELLKYLQERNNEMRTALGRKPIPTLDDYWPFVRAFTVAQDLGLSPNLVLDSAKKLLAHQRDLAHVPFVYEHARTKSIYSPKNDAFTLLQNYVNSAVEQITVAPLLEKLGEMINKPMPRLESTPGNSTSWSLSRANPILYSYLSQWRNDLMTGTRSGLWFADTPATDRFMTRALQYQNRSMGLALLAGKLRTGLVQFSTIAQTTHQLGPVNTAKGIASLMYDGVFHHFADHFDNLQYSNVLNSRSINTVLNDATTAITAGNLGDFGKLIARGEVTKLQSAIGTPGYALMKFTDEIAAHIAWESAFKLAREKLGMGNVDAGRVADNVTVMTQAGTMPGDMVGIQRTALGQFGTKFQHFVISEWNYLLNEVFNGETYMKKMLREAKGKPEPNFYFGLTKSIISYVVLQEAINSLYDSAGMTKPMPSPIMETIKEGTRHGSSIGSVLGTLAGELSEYMPIIAPTRYGRGLGGPTIDTVRESIESIRGRPMAYPLYKEGDTMADISARALGSPIARLLGIPYAGAFGTFIRGQARGENVWGSLVGTYRGPTSGQGGITRDVTSPTQQSIHRQIR